MPMRPPLEIPEAVDVLARGGVLAYPTEGVWGLGCNPFDEAAVLRVLAIKQRDIAKGLILAASQAGQLAAIVNWDALDPERRAAVLDSWPGPNTWVLPATTGVPRWITGGHSDVAVRISGHPVVRALCEGFGGALVSTSANIAGQPAPQHRDQLEPELLARLDGITTGETGGRTQPSTIRDARTGRTLRA